MSTHIKDNLLLVCGKSGSGKSASLMNVSNHESILLMNCEAGKKLPFKNDIKSVVITKPAQVLQGFAAAEKSDKIELIAIDTFTYLMDMFESQNVINSSNTMKGWQDYGQYIKTLMQDCVANCSKDVVFLAHTKTDLNETEGVMETYVPVKGAAKGNGFESYFSNVVATKKMSLEELEPYENDNLIITEDDEILGFKHVFQTRLTKATKDERIRAPIGMWEREETFIDNDVEKVLNRLREFYA